MVYFLSALLGEVWISQLHYIYENKAQGTGGARRFDAGREERANASA